MSDYVLNEREQPRLAAQAERLDTVTFRHLEAVGEVIAELQDDGGTRWAYSPMLVSTRGRRPGAQGRASGRR